MRSTESSGVGAPGFALPEARRLAFSNYEADGLRTILMRTIGKVSPITLTVTVTAFLAVGLFVVYDAARTLQDARSHVEMVAQALANELSALDSETAGRTLLQSLQTYDRRLSASLQGLDGHLIASTDPLRSVGIGFVAGRVPSSELVSADAQAGAVGTVHVGLDQNGVFGGMAQRGAGALLVALAISALTFRRRDGAIAPTRRERKLFEDLIGTIPFGVACWNEAGEMLVCNEQYRARLNISHHEAKPGTTYQGSVRELIRGGYMRVVSEVGSNRILELHREDGSCLLIDERPFAENGFVTLVTDVTERKRTDLLLSSIREEQRQLARRYHEEKIRAEAASRSKTNFLAHLSHDIRTPLNHIIGFADLMRHQTYGALGDSRYLGYVEAIKNSGERLLASFATILELAELEGGQKVLREEAIDIDALMHATVDRFKIQAARAGLSFVVGAPAETTILGDRFCLERMLGNIVDNALRFTPSGGKVTLAAFVAADGVVIEISDTGIGMSEQRLESLSQPFVFGDAAFTRTNGGTGLGIAIARAIAELSGGRLAIDSSPALGTTVAISLPIRAVSDEVIQAAE